MTDLRRLTATELAEATVRATEQQDGPAFNAILEEVARRPEAERAAYREAWAALVGARNAKSAPRPKPGGAVAH